MGRLSKEKGLHLLPGLATALTRRGVPHRFVIVGRGPMEGELRAAMPDAVFTGILEGERLSAVYASGDVFVFPSQTDTAGNVVLEAQASGLPVAVSSVGGPRENLLDGRTGHVAQDNTADTWLHRVAPLLEHAAYREAMGAAAGVMPNRDRGPSRSSRCSARIANWARRPSATPGAPNGPRDAGAGLRPRPRDPDPTAHFSGVSVSSLIRRYVADMAASLSGWMLNRNELRESASAPSPTVR